MSTRGFVGFVSDRTEKIAYNHSDSYPDALGLDVLKWLRFAVADLDDPAGGVPSLRESVMALRVVDGESTPTEGDVERLAGFADLGVSARDPREWYVLLRETQGSPGRMLQAGVIQDAADFPADSLFAEWGYIVDLDTGVFEVYRGFQQEPHNRGRFADRTPRESTFNVPRYFPVALVHGWRLDDLPSDDAFLKTFTEDGDE